MLVTDELIRRLEESDGAWLEESVSAAGGEVLRVGSCVAAYAGAGNVLTQVVGTGLESETKWDDVLDHYRGRCDSFEVKLSPLANPDIRRQVAAAAVDLTEFDSLFVGRPRRVDVGQDMLRVEELNSSDIESFVRRTAGWFYAEDEPPGFVSTISCALSLPTSQTFVIRVRDEIVGGASLTCSRGVGWLHGGAVDPAHRRRGIQNALLRHRLSLTSDLGVDLVAMGASPGSSSGRNAQRIGLQVAYTRPCFWVSTLA